MWDLKCIAAALCFLTSNILFIVHGVIMMETHNAQSHTADANDGSINNGVYDSSNSYNDNLDKEQSAIKPTSFNFENWKELDPAYIEARWDNREQSRPIMMSAALFGAFAWFWLIAPIVQCAWVLSRGGKRMVGPHLLLAAMAICGGLIELISRLMIVGMTNASQWLARDFNLDYWDHDGTQDGTGWRVLEMIHVVTHGMLLWIDAFEALALFGMVVVIFYSVATEPKFKTRRSSSIIVEEEDSSGADAASGSGASLGDSAVNAPSSSPPQSAFSEVTTKVPVEPTFTKCFAGYGIFVGLLALADFVADVLRFLNWSFFGRIAMATNALLGVIFLPIWLLCLARQLPGATERFERAEIRASILLDDERLALKGNEREIS